MYDTGQSVALLLILLFFAFILPAIAMWMDDEGWVNRIHHHKH